MFSGYSFGCPVSTTGEMVLNTDMVGYLYSLTDPSYCSQILVFPYPLVGNYGVPDFNTSDSLSKYFEEDRIHIKEISVNKVEGYLISNVPVT